MRKLGLTGGVVFAVLVAMPVMASSPVIRVTGGRGGSAEVTLPAGNYRAALRLKGAAPCHVVYARMSKDFGTVRSDMSRTAPAVIALDMTGGHYKFTVKGCAWVLTIRAE